MFPPANHSAAIALSLFLSFAATADDVAFTYPPNVSIEAVTEYIASASKVHPRLFANAETFERLPSVVKASPLKQTIANGVVNNAKKLLDAKPVERKLEGRRLLGVSRRCLERVLTLSMAYHLTQEDQFADRCEREMLAAAAFTDWNPSHFLDVAEMTLALSIGYDWLFHELSPESRQTLRDAILRKGVILPWETKHKGWVRATNNWGQVCHAGLTAGALAIMEDEPELAARTVLNAVSNVPRSMHAFEPKGSYPEGPGYWAYGTGFNVLLIAELESVLGVDFGLSKAPGFSETGGYLAMVTGPSGLTFNYADGGSGRGPQESLFWFANRFERPEFLRGEKDRIVETFSDRRGGAGGRLMPLALLWMEEDAFETTRSLPLHWSSEGIAPITIHRSSWDGGPATFVGIKAGSPSSNHAHMDAGSFVLDADGVRWATDLGAEGYHGIESRGMNLWSMKQDSDRWTIFRQQNHSHNTLVIDDSLQRSAGRAEVVAFSDDPQRPLTIVDLSEVYQGQADSIRRGVRMLPTGEVWFQDELTGLEPGTIVRWGMVTPTKDLSNRSPEVMLLRQGDASLKLTIESPTESKWQQIDTETPRNPWDSSNRGTTMVAFEAVAPDSGTMTLSVLATPGSVKSSQAESAKGNALADW
ncbi:heparinase II/III domain-containing protein [Novipirellula artificiosorum]|uniref:Heparinase II/III-like protein n=1 Tax=Novipirellula artificiosorum TaxID=2528016 RepID=A0A5C6DEI5_9BACT|nr:heparinase II/III family protein [Novipirellula artificiosorum]TWU35078.1 Heparinase II/III-like protein [Novipirellula artificiosorum]